MFKLGIYKQQLVTMNVLLAIVVVLLTVLILKPSQGEGAPAVITAGATTETEAPAVRDYQIDIQTFDKFVLYEGDRVIWVFDRNEHPNCELFKRIGNDIREND